MTYDEEVEAVESMSVEEIRARVLTPNRCWSDSFCDCVQQAAAERMLDHYDVLTTRVAFLTSLCIRAVAEGWTETRVMDELTADRNALVRDD